MPASPDTVVIVPMLGRPHTVAPLIESLAETTDRATPLFVCTLGDHKVIEAVRASGARHLLVRKRERGDYAYKINTAVRYTDEPYIFLGACDLKFHPGWLDTCLSRLDDLTRVVGTNDLANARTMRGEHSTHSLLTRDYTYWGLIDGTPGVLFEGYWHEYCDDEFVWTARYRGAYVSEPTAIVEHLHPSVGKAEWDDSYRRQQERMHASVALYHARSRLWT